MMKNILFDMDGTLFDTSPGILTCMDYVLKYYNITKFSLDDLRLCIGPPLSWTFEELFGLPKDMVDDAIKVYRQKYNGGEIFNVTPIEGMEECLKFLHENGYFISVCSSKPEVACRKILEKYHLISYFDDVCGAIPEEGIESKEDVLELFFSRHTDANPKETLLVGDTKYDAAGAKEFKVNFLGVNYGFGTEEELRAFGAEHIVSSAREVLEFIEKC